VVIGDHWAVTNLHQSFVFVAIVVHVVLHLQSYFQAKVGTIINAAHVVSSVNLSRHLTLPYLRLLLGVAGHGGLIVQPLTHAGRLQKGEGGCT
jgi:hypothetical protein